MYTQTLSALETTVLGTIRVPLGQHPDRLSGGTVSRGIGPSATRPGKLGPKRGEVTRALVGQARVPCWCIGQKATGWVHQHEHGEGSNGLKLFGFGYPGDSHAIFCTS